MSIADGVVALTTAGLFAIVNEFAMSVGMSQSQLRSGHIL